MAVTAPSWAPALPAGRTSLARALDELMWVIQAEHDHFSERVQIRGYLKPPPGAATEVELLDGCAEAYEEILDILDQAGAEIYRNDAVPEWLPDGFRVAVLIEIWDGDG